MHYTGCAVDKMSEVVVVATPEPGCRPVGWVPLLLSAADMADKRFVELHRPGCQGRQKPAEGPDWAGSSAGAIDRFVLEGTRVDSLVVVERHKLGEDSLAEGLQHRNLGLGS